MDVKSWQQSERQEQDMPPRLSSLAKLPVFWDLNGKRVVVVGGSEAAAWKAELLAACGAEIHIYARELVDVFASLVGDLSSSHGRYVHHSRMYTVADLKGAVLAVGDFGTDTEANIFLEAGIAAGVPVNVIDKPAFCQFQFGSIVNRSPVIVAISTDGAAPILAQAIRRRVEAILPSSLRPWAELAQSLRTKINNMLESGPSRRHFWERFVDRVFSGTPDDNTLIELLTETANGKDSHSHKGKVTFVFAGPGDPELLTLKAIRALQAADVIFFGDRILNEILELARREARRIAVSPSEETAVDHIVELLDEGKNVVRIELSDPASALRFGKEMFSLRQMGIPAPVIPGVGGGEDDLLPELGRMNSVSQHTMSHALDKLRA